MKGGFSFADLRKAEEWEKYPEYVIKNEYGFPIGAKEGAPQVVLDSLEMRRRINEKGIVNGKRVAYYD